MKGSAEFPGKTLSARRYAGCRGDNEVLFGERGQACGKVRPGEGQYWRHSTGATVMLKFPVVVMMLSRSCFDVFVVVVVLVMMDV